MIQKEDQIHNGGGSFQNGKGRKEHLLCNYFVPESIKIIFLRLKVNNLI